MSDQDHDFQDKDFKGNEFKELSKTVLTALFIAIAIRSILFEPFNIPSGSMKPNLLIGDYLFVTKYSYGLSRHSFPFGIAPIEGRMGGEIPDRGEIAVFKLPTNERVDYIKRIIGLPGDRIQVRKGRLYINGDLVKREKLAVETDPDTQQEMTRYRETLPNGVYYEIYEAGDNGPLDNTDVYIVPEGHFFMMGDNRDNSQDSRVTALVGAVPIENMVGPARTIFLSTTSNAALYQIWKWPFELRGERFLKDLNAGQP